MGLPGFVRHLEYAENVLAVVVIATHHTHPTSSRVSFFKEESISVILSVMIT